MERYDNKEAGILLLIFIFSTSLFSSSCNLIINQQLNFKEDLGNISFSDINSTFTWLSPEMGDRSTSFNFDDLFELTNYSGSYYFRMNGKAYNHSGSKQTFLYDLTWVSNILPLSNHYSVRSYATDRKPIFQLTLDTVGDSITWWQQGRFLRCLMRDKGLTYDFIGFELFRLFLFNRFSSSNIFADCSSILSGCFVTKASSCSILANKVVIRGSVSFILTFDHIYIIFQEFFEIN